MLNFRTHVQYPMIEFPANISEDGYLAELGKRFHIKNYFVGDKERKDKALDRLFYIASTCTYTLFPESMNWHIYGEYDIELARLVSTVGLPPDMLFPHDFYTEDEAKRLMAFKESS